MIETCIIESYLSMDNARCREFSLDRTSILGKDKDGDSLIADSIETSGGFYLRHFKAEGTIRFPRAKIVGDLSCIDIQFCETGRAANFAKCTVTGVFFLRCKKSGLIDFSGAHFESIAADDQSWFLIREIRIDGFTYKKITSPKMAVWNSTKWLAWLDLQSEDHRSHSFRPQPYAYLAQVLSENGHEDYARDILVRKNRMMRQNKINFPLEFGYPDRVFAQIQWKLSIVGDYLLDKIVGYGYRPWTAVGYLLIFVLIGAIIFEMSAQIGIMTPSEPLVYQNKTIPNHCQTNWVVKTSPGGDAECMAAMPSEYTPFSSIIYSIDLAIPVIHFGQSESWSPRSTKPPHGDFDVLGFLVRGWFYLQRAAGWILSLFFISAVSGVVRK